MRNENRIPDFCNELAEIWMTKCPDWRFGQMMINVLGEMAGQGRDPFFPEEQEMMDFFKEYFHIEEKEEEEEE